MTIDIDLLVPAEKRSQWLDLMRDLGFQFAHGTTTFAQFAPPQNAEEPVPVDLMFVDMQTWNSLHNDAKQESLAGHQVYIPRAEHLIALKLHAAVSPTRSSPHQDWDDIRYIIKICRLNPSDAYFHEIILRYGGEEALSRIRKIWDET